MDGCDPQEVSRSFSFVSFYLFGVDRYGFVFASGKNGTDVLQNGAAIIIVVIVTAAHFVLGVHVNTATVSNSSVSPFSATRGCGSFPSAAAAATTSCRSVFVTSSSPFFVVVPAVVVVVRHFLCTLLCLV